MEPFSIETGVLRVETELPGAVEVLPERTLEIRSRMFG